MKIAAISDIHGNLPALDAVLDEIESENVDMVVVCGDVATGPMPGETIRRLMQLTPDCRFVRGNSDRELIDCFDGEPISPDAPSELRTVVRWCADAIGKAERDFTTRFRDQVYLVSPDQERVLFCHAVPGNDTWVFTQQTPEADVRHFFADTDAEMVVCGHTHMQFQRKVAGRRIVNAGSVGMPYGSPGAYWLLIDKDIEFRRTSYDYGRAAKLIRSTGYPDAVEFAERNVLRPPSEAEALAVFEDMARRQRKRK